MNEKSTARIAIIAGGLLISQYGLHQSPPDYFMDYLGLFMIGVVIAWVIADGLGKTHDPKN